MNVKKLLLIAALVPMANVVFAADPVASLLPTFGAEGATVSSAAKGGNKITGWLPKDWVDNSEWAALSVTYSKLADAPKDGVTAVSINVTKIEDGQLQLTSWVKLAFKKGVKYVVEGWIRSKENSDFKVLIREMGAPYESFAEQALETTGEWTPFIFPFSMSTDDEALVMFTKAEAGNVDLAGITVHEVTGNVAALGVLKEKVPGLLPDFGKDGAEFSVAAKGGNKITGWLPSDWNDNSDWAAVSATYSKLSDAPKAGIAAVRVAVTKVEDGQLQLTSWRQPEFKKDVKYVVDGWIRSKDSAGIKLTIRQTGEPYAAYAEQSLEGTPEWKPFAFTFSLSADHEAFVMFTKGEVGTVDLAGISAHEAQ